MLQGLQSTVGLWFSTLQLLPEKSIAGEAPLIARRIDDQDGETIAHPRGGVGFFPFPIHGE